MGVGNIGTQIVEIMNGLKLEVKGVDPVKKIAELEYISLEDGIGWADVIFCAVPLTDETTGMLSYDVLKNIKKGSLLINISRGEVSPVLDVGRLVEEGILGGLSLDVYQEETTLAGKLRGEKIETNKVIDMILRLKDKENILFTPHNAFNTRESLLKKAEHSVKSIVAMLEAGNFHNEI